MYWMFLALQTIGTAAVLFALIVCCMAFAAWIEDRRTRHDA